MSLNRIYSELLTPSVYLSYDDFLREVNRRLACLSNGVTLEDCERRFLMCEYDLCELILIAVFMHEVRCAGIFSIA